ncbi:MAG: glycoside hydrolase family 16 protein, partial [Clostridia bacterium]|nr:glycoside hydrolase family 16 protein [Clostridia bacterium]
WVQSYSGGKIRNKGKDGTEIDVYESSFARKNPTKTGNALHWDAYDSPYYRCRDHISDTGKNLYDGQYHKYSLLWTPEYYVFYVDRQPVWATAAGGVSTVKEYLRLTVEVRDGKIGPYGQSLGKFANANDGSTDFSIKSVNVWQKMEYEESICSDGSYADMKRSFDRAIGASVATGALIAIAIMTLFVLIIKRVYSRKRFE